MEMSFFGSIYTKIATRYFLGKNTMKISTQLLAKIKTKNPFQKKGKGFEFKKATSHKVKRCLKL